MTDTTWTQPAAQELLTQVRRIVAEHPSRHWQASWFSGRFGTPENVTVDEARAYALTDVPEAPEDPERPVCGTTACVAGWLAILGSPSGTVIDSHSLRLPDGSRFDIWYEAQRLAGLSYDQQNWLFSGSRSRQEVLDGLDALIENPEADLRDLYIVKRNLTVKVVAEDGTELSSRPVEIVYDRRSAADDGDVASMAISRAYYLQ